MNGKKVLITGASGMLGSNLIKFITSKQIVGYTSELDITNFELINEKLNQEKPDIIIHTAAYTNVEDSEVNAYKAYSVNTIGTQNLVNYCIGKNILFIYISSTGIYGKAKNDRYTEFDDACPTTIHHKSKYEAEKIVNNHLNKYLIIRTGWLYGGDKMHSKNFVYKRFLEASNNDIIYSNNIQIGNPTSVIDLAKQIDVLIEKEQYGIFNCVNEAKSISRYDYVKKIVELFNLSCRVNIASENSLKRVAPVSNNESAMNYKLNLLGLNVMGDWEKSLREYIIELKSVL